jgi:hypothetical protein
MSNFDTAIDRVLANEGGYVNAVQEALNKASHEAASIFIPPASVRPYGCSVGECIRPAYAKQLCNAHYLRARKGLDLTVAVRARKREDLCVECGKVTGAKGGWGLCSLHYRARRYAVIKDALIAAMGGMCCRCHGKFPRAVFDFHHVGGKEESPSAILQNRSVEAIAAEMAKCILLCANCHRLEHHVEL